MAGGTCGLDLTHVARFRPGEMARCALWAAVPGSATRMYADNRKTTNPLTEEPDAENPSVRFGGRNQVKPWSLPLSSHAGLTAGALRAGLARSDCQQKCQQGVYWRSTDGVLTGFYLSTSEARCHFAALEASALTDSDLRPIPRELKTDSRLLGSADSHHPTPW